MGDSDIVLRDMSQHVAADLLSANWKKKIGKECAKAGQERAKDDTRLCGAYLLRQWGRSGRAYLKIVLEGFHSRRSHLHSLGCAYGVHGGLIP